jgi:hypothetical protein
MPEPDPDYIEFFEQFKELLKYENFKPFVLHVSGGPKFQVEHAWQCEFYLGVVEIYFRNERAVLIPSAQIACVEVLEPKPSN